MDHPDLKYTATSHSYVEQELRKLDTNNQAYRLKISKWESKRTLSANAQIHVFIGQIAKFTSTDALTAKCEAKIDFGIPVLMMAEDDRSRLLDFLLTSTNFYSRSREWQIRIINGIAITSVLTTKESKVVMDDMIYYWNDKGLDIGYKE